MKYLMILTIGVCLLIGTVPAVADQAADEAAIKKVYEQLVTAINKKDIKTYEALCSEDIEDWPGTAKGRAAMVKWASEYWESRKDLQMKQLEEIGVVFVSPDVAIHKTREEVTGLLDAGGKPLPTLTRLAAWVFAKKNGKWLYAAHFSRPIEE